MRILVVGANGQLGRDCIQLFSSVQGSADRGGTRLSRPSCGPVLRPLSGSAPCEAVLGLDLPDIDITDPASVAAAFAAFRPNAVVNCAAYTRVDDAESHEGLCSRINADGPANLAAACDAAGAILVHVSTDYVFDGAKPLGQAYVEDDPPAPASAYGRTKLAGEAPVLAYAKGAVLRTAWLYGATGANFLRTMLRLSLRRPPAPIRVVDDQHGSPTWSGSLARQIGRLLGDFHPGLYHATSQGSCTWYGLTRRFFSAAGIDHEVVPIATADYPTPARRPANSVLENRNLKRLGLDAMPPWEEDVDAFARAVVPAWTREILEQTK